VRQVLLVCNALYFSKIYREVFVPRHTWRVRADFWLRRWLVRRSAESSDVVMTPTQALLDDLRPEVKVGKALVNPYGVAEEDFLPQPAGAACPALGAESDRSVRLVYVSLYAEHKNLTTLLRALPLLNTNGTRRFSLKTTVNPAWENASQTTTCQSDRALAQRHDVAPWVEFVGPFDPRRMCELYGGADIFVFPSLIESFGHPMVEAMAAGLPIVAADTPVNREICGETAKYFQPLSPEDLAAQVNQVATDPALRQGLCFAGRRRARAMPRWDEHVMRALEAAQAR
jgi:glycosyltransferase involved in cell wall biosynthesis